ncbi:DinB family protein [bacterium AH-315-P13]|nr:DinB family protein [bacterium AH-315-P13]MBN4085562.1 DinB family protein [Flavobacteriaceae bacterium AH-315-B10]
MKQEKWVNRKFTFSNDENNFSSTVEILKGTSIILKDKISKVETEKHLMITLDGKWSILENIGHLIALDQLWLERIRDILENKEKMRSAYLQKGKFQSANYNNRNVLELIIEFSEKRSKLIEKLEDMTEAEIYKRAIHPRLKTSMSIMNLLFMAAMHDYHHLSRINTIIKDLKCIPKQGGVTSLLNFR